MQQRTVEIEESLYEVLKETDLLAFQTKLAIGKQLTRLDHFQDVTDDELMVISFWAIFKIFCLKERIFQFMYLFWVKSRI